MEDIRGVVAKIVARCGEQGREGVDEALAAFVARVMVMENPKEFQLDRTMTEKSVKALVERSAEKICEQDSAHMETLRMQVEFDSIFSETEDALESAAHARKVRLANMRSSIVNSEKDGDGSEFEQINALYRKVFNYLLCCVDVESGKDNSVDREVAAALESVFPKISLKSFITLDPEDQKSQLGELANIVMGIRLFNKHIGKGGASIKDAQIQCRKSAQRLLTALKVEKQTAQQSCDDYSVSIVFAHAQGSKLPEAPKPKKIDRWHDELRNRRQYLAFLNSLEEDAHQTLQTLQEIEQEFDTCMDDLQGLVSSRTSVPKEKVYPKFDLAAELWYNIEQERDLIDSRHIVWATLQKFRDSCSFTLSSSWLDLAKAWEQTHPDGGEALDNAAASSKQTSQSVPGIDVESTERAVDNDTDVETDREGKTESKQRDDVPHLLHYDEAPDFMGLTLEFRGFCAYTAGQRRGLLLPGDPSLGVVQYKGKYYVFYSAAAVREFQASPETVIANLLSVTRQHPELILLMDLHEHFPEATLSNFYQNKKGAKTLTAAIEEKPRMVNASTETPTHFVERHIDPSYEWNEWALRRRALQHVNLRNAKTSSTQTAKSHFRRENESQVYLPRAQATQTGIHKATNPPRQHQYIIGLRGLAKSKYARYRGDEHEEVDSLSATHSESKVTESRTRSVVLNLKYEL